MTLLSTTPDTFSYMVLGYAVILGAMAIYVLSLVLRNRRIDRELQIVEELEAEK
jgi:nitrate reductase gamma subunit